MQVCSVVAGNTAFSDCSMPFKPSVTAIRMSWVPRVLSSLNTFIQNLAPSVCSIHRPRMSRVPSGNTASARYTALLRTTPSSRILTLSASKNTTGYMVSNGRLCQAVTSSITASVTELMNSGETSVPYCSARNPWISRTVIPRAYIAMILSSNPVKRRSCLGIRIGAKLPSRSRGISTCSGPSSVSTVLRLLPLRWLVTSSGRSPPAG
ncbi:hypothetical protein LMG26858_06311 [Achromobacter anxifer]|uniref:Uncharacterized protein n=1 Tax=Achromobacter anxifer TaxID=1287737 RepID=A0A6S7EXS3_9BURK|nr:hypothetical protein LMG26858_06311 [Achromobacter anxifer]